MIALRKSLSTPCSPILGGYWRGLGDTPKTPAGETSCTTFSIVIARLDPRFHGDAIQRGRFMSRPYGTPPSFRYRKETFFRGFAIQSNAKYVIS